MWILDRILGLAGLLVLLLSVVFIGLWLFGYFEKEWIPLSKLSVIILLCCGTSLFTTSIVLWCRSEKRDSLWNMLFDSRGRFPDFLRGAGFGLGLSVVFLVAYVTCSTYFESAPVLLGGTVFFSVGTVIELLLYFLWERKRKKAREEC